ncbi:hypothetical protein MYCTH_2128383 [Thermothelomyces thermophilus ATCC 42464]|uniref:Uncharacterized protein n=1 Tax=Thermothelomyces thermophilus (strain ATCC 42464 / BCRC 31852 / DSM 1799) TaxID=573729 RepID=G2QG69_THET4|nr:uncharacterized protein MYCTH_2128383 [Thermothelomyces thermophilus ATCC 42464]AEO59329.1 hypothetical protein MYCTH_2128383 [Thermothelomyces thermophilus ATCC 42464]
MAKRDQQASPSGTSLKLTFVFWYHTNNLGYRCLTLEKAIYDTLIYVSHRSTPRQHWPKALWPPPTYSSSKPLQFNNSIVCCGSQEMGVTTSPTSVVRWSGRGYHALGDSEAPELGGQQDLSDFQLYTVYKSLRSCDFTSHSPPSARVHHSSWPVTIQDRFAGSTGRLSHTGTLPYFVMQGLANRNLSYSEGISAGYAFQSVRHDLPDTAQTSVTVDGFGNSLDLRAGRVGPEGIVFARPSLPASVARFADTRCDGTKDDSGRRILVMFGNLTYTVDSSVTLKDYTGMGTRHPMVGKLVWSTQMLCVPTYGITRVDVVRNGTQTLNVTTSAGAPRRTLSSVTARNLMDAHYTSSYDGSLDPASIYGKNVKVGHDLVDVNEQMGLALPLLLPPDRSPSALLDRTTLQKLVTACCRQVGAVIAKQSLMEPASIPSQAAVIMVRNRFVVRGWAARWMAGLAATCAALKQSVSPETYATLDFMDMSVRLQPTTAFLVASVFTIFSSSLFQALAVTETVSIELRATRSIDMDQYMVQDGNAIASLIFASNYSFPSFNYDDLAFPRLALTHALPTDGALNDSTVSIQAVVPAVRARFSCRTYDSSQITTNLTLNYTSQMSGYHNPLGINIRGEDCRRLSDEEEYAYTNILPTYANMTYFGLGDASSRVSQLQGCSQLLYTWGKLDYHAAGAVVQHVTAVGCNETVSRLAMHAISPYWNLAHPGSDPHYLIAFFAMLHQLPLGRPAVLAGRLLLLRRRGGRHSGGDPPTPRHHPRPDLCPAPRPVQHDPTQLSRSPRVTLPHQRKAHSKRRWRRRARDNTPAIKTPMTDGVPVYRGTASTPPDGGGRRASTGLASFVVKGGRDQKEGVSDQGMIRGNW